MDPGHRLLRDDLLHGGPASRLEGQPVNGGLASKEVVRLELDGTAVKHEERMFGDLGKRIRQVSQGPDGALYLLTDENRGEILRVAPAGKP